MYKILVFDDSKEDDRDTWKFHQDPVKAYCAIEDIFSSLRRIDKFPNPFENKVLKEFKNDNPDTNITELTERDCHMISQTVYCIRETIAEIVNDANIEDLL